jgi:hypothetical protein
VFYAGGGGGGQEGNALPLYGGTVVGFGGAGGGGNGGSGLPELNENGTAGLTNTGGGGGGGSRNYAGNRGGSGIVIIRYPSYLAPATSTTGSPEMIIAGAWRVYTFVASGTITF